MTEKLFGNGLKKAYHFSHGSSELVQWPHWGEWNEIQCEKDTSAKSGCDHCEASKDVIEYLLRFPTVLQINEWTNERNEMSRFGGVNSRPSNTANLGIERGRKMVRLQHTFGGIVWKGIRWRHTGFQQENWKDR